MSDRVGNTPTTTANARMAYARSAVHDATPAIPRALEASHGLFREIRIFCWNRMSAPLPAKESADGVTIERFEKAARPRSWGILLLTLKYQLWLFWKLVCYRPNVVQVLDFESALPARAACLLTRASLIYDMRDPVSMSYRLPPWFKKLLYAVDWLLVGSSTAMVLPAENLRQYLGRWGRSKRKPVVVVRNTCHDWLGNPPAESFEVQKPAPVRIALMGHISPHRGPGSLIELARREPERVELVVAGHCRFSDLVEAFEELPNIKFLGRLPYQDALALMRDCDLVALLCNPEIPSYRMVTGPTKFFESLMAGTPLLVNREIELANTITQHGLGYLVEYGNVDDLQGVVDRICSTRDDWGALRRRCRKYYLDHCQLSQELVPYREFYNTVLKRAA